VAKRRVNLIFSEDITAQPVIYNLGQQFEIVTNIIRADITESGGVILVEIEGSERDIDEGIEFAISRGVRVEEAFSD